MPIPDEISIHFDDAQPPIRCHSIQEVDATLDALHRNALGKTPPLTVAIEVFGHEVDLGLGTDPTFLHLQIQPCDGEYYLAVGDLTEGEVKMFYGAGQDSYWEPKNLIPLELARSAARFFVEHQRRCPLVRWQDWKGQDV